MVLEDCKAKCKVIVDQADKVIEKQSLFIIEQTDSIATLRAENRDLRLESETSVEWYYYVGLGVAAGLAGSILLLK